MCDGHTSTKHREIIKNGANGKLTLFTLFELLTAILDKEINLCFISD